MFALQYWFYFCHTSTWINHRYIYVPSPLESLSHLLPILTPLGYCRAPVWVPWVIQKISICYLFKYVIVYASMLLCPFILSSPSSPQPLSISLVSMSASPSLLCKQVHQYHPSRFHIYVLIYGTPNTLCCSVSESCLTLQSRALQHVRLSCLSPSPGVCSDACPLSQWCHPTISSSVVLFSSCPQSFPASGSFPMSQFFASGSQSIGASASVLPMNI